MKIVHENHEDDFIVELHPHDTWSLDNTLAQIIVPLLKQLRVTTHGSPIVDNEDVPEEFHCPAAEEMDFMDEAQDNKFHERWNWVLDEMIWAFEQHANWNDCAQFTINPNNVTIKSEKNEQGHKVIKFVAKDPSRPKTSYDREGIKKHEERKARGRMLFAKYYSGLWD